MSESTTAVVRTEETAVGAVVATVTPLATVPIGPQGIQGIQGDPGEGVPAGGTTGQVLKKQSGVDYDADWEDETGGGGGGAVDSVNGATGVVVLDAADVGAATAVQGATADTAVQPGDLATVATTGAYSDLTGKPTLGTAAAAATGDFDAAGAAAAAQAASQPLDSDLTAIAALSTTSYGRAFLALADAAAGRTALGLGTAATTASTAYDAAGSAAAAQAASQPLDSDLTAVAGLTPSNDDVLQRKAGVWTNRTIAQLVSDMGLGSVYQPLDSDLTAIAALTTTTFGRSLLAAADAAALRTLGGLVIGTNVQAYNANLAALAGLTLIADRLPYANGSGTLALATLTAAGRALLDDADADAQLATLGAADRENGGLETVVAHGNTGATETIDLAGGNVHTAAQDQACVYTFTGATNGKACSFTLILTSVTGAATWPASVDWADATAPTLSGVTILSFLTVDGGTTWYGFPGGKAFA